MGEVNELLNRLGELDEAPLIWINKKVYDMAQEIERLKEELEWTIPIVEHNKTITKHLKEIERLYSIIKEVKERVLNENKPLPSAREIIEILDKVSNNE